jgi:hypothetical protein
VDDFNALLVEFAREIPMRTFSLWRDLPLSGVLYRVRSMRTDQPSVEGQSSLIGGLFE